MRNIEYFNKKIIMMLEYFTHCNKTISFYQNSNNLHNFAEASTSWQDKYTIIRHTDRICVSILNLEDKELVGTSLNSEDEI